MKTIKDELDKILPENFRVEYSLKSIEENERSLFFCVHKNGGFTSDNSRRKLYIFSNGKIEEAKVKDFTRYLDGGTTDISYIFKNAEGSLHIPAQHKISLFKEKMTNIYGQKTTELSVA